MADRIDPNEQNHFYELLGPDRSEPVAHTALCGYRPVRDPNTMNKIGGYREREQTYEDCAECWDIARTRWPQIEPATSEAL